ncbi:Sec-independent protein translocase TatA, partial [Micromonospora azadirachtae]
GPQQPQTAPYQAAPQQPVVDPVQRVRDN